MDIHLTTKPVSQGARGLVLVCVDCQRPTAHEQFPNKPAHCLFCDAASVPCAGNCGAWVAFEAAGLVHLCEPCETAAGLR
jgi:hypothetical protein